MRTDAAEIMIDSYALKLTLVHYTNQIQGNWNGVTMFGVFLSLAIPLFTCDFHDAFGMKAAVIESSVQILCVVALICSLWLTLKRWINKPITPEELVDKIKEKAAETTVSITTTQI